MRRMSVAGVAILFGAGIFSASAQSQRTPDRKPDNFQQVQAYGPRVVDLNSARDGGDGYATRGTGDGVAANQGTRDHRPGEPASDNRGTTANVSIGKITTGDVRTGDVTTGRVKTGSVGTGKVGTGSVGTSNEGTNNRGKAELETKSPGPDGGNDARSGFPSAAGSGVPGR